MDNHATAEQNRIARANAGARLRRIVSLTAGLLAPVIALSAVGCSTEGANPHPIPTPPTPPSSQPPGAGPMSERQPHVPPPPTELVGTWNGGPGDSSDWWLTVDAQGSYTLLNDRLGWRDAGFVDASAHGFVMSNASGDGRVAQAAGVSGCEWTIARADVIGPMLTFCGATSAWVR